MINEEIRAKELRVIAADGTQLGIMSREEALALSEEKTAGSGLHFTEGKSAGLQDPGLREVQI